MTDTEKSEDAAREPEEREEDAEPDEHTKEQIEAERRERLDPENRPDDAEVDNTQRDFDEEKGKFTDSEGYEEAEPRFPPASEQDT